MEDLDIDPSQEELALCEVDFEEWDQLRVRDYWDAVVAEELGARQSPSSPYVWRSMGPGEKERLRRYERRTTNTTLRLVMTAVAEPIQSAPNLGEAA